MTTSTSGRLGILLAQAVLIAGTVLAQEASDHPTLPVRPSVLLQTSDGRREFHFGEMIHLKVQYVTPQPGRYVHAQVNDFKGGHPWQWQCEPTDSVVNRRTDDGRISAQRFYYAAANCRKGVGSGIGGGCGDCRGENPLGPTPISYEILLNNDIQFMQPGRYTCHVATADVATITTGADEGRSAIELISNPVMIDLVEDVTWSAATLAAAREQLAAAHCVGLPDEGARCWDPVNTMRFLDTEESLTELVRSFNGINKAHWQESLWLGILQSQHSKLARELLEKRMSDSDFSVTTGFLDTLTAMVLRENDPALFRDPISDAEASGSYKPALEILRKYVRQLGAQLSKKRAQALATSLETYTAYASQSFCEDKPLVPQEELQKSVAAAKRKQH